MKSKDMLEKSSEGEHAESVREKTIRESVRKLLSETDMHQKSDINRKMIISLTRGYVFAEEYNQPVVKKLCDYILRLSVSKERKGREELVTLVTGINESNNKDERKLFERLLG